ncbi:MAG TPA: DNA polymerase ligase N-terminal domain-containing protein [Longimicrobiales bacterium]
MAAKKARAKQARTALKEYQRKRDFTKTAEPSGDAAVPSHDRLVFVIQKHAASHLHYDFRLELGGVMKSWAVPKGPSVNPAVKRLAMEVEDHPMGYNTFEGTIPQGEYGGGTVMLWDRGTYTADEAGPSDDVEKILRGEYRAGRMKITLDGERLRGSWALVRTDPGPKPKWLLIKHRDEHARRHEATTEFDTSVVTDRTMEEIAGGDRVWHSNRGAGSGRARPARTAAAKTSSQAAKPMRATSVRSIPDEGRVLLPWHDGVRVLAYATADACALIAQDGRDVSGDHSDIASGLAGLASRAKKSFIIDGVIADDDRLHVIDLLFAGDEPVVEQAWTDRRAALETLFRRRRVAGVALEEVLEDVDDAGQLAADHEWAGILAVDPDAPYSPGKRTRAWLLLGM